MKISIMPPSHAALSALSIDEKINVRRTGRGSEPAFVASIRKKGVIEPLTVRFVDADHYAITNGGKRYAALEWMRAHGELAAGVAVTSDYPVPVVVRQESDVEARETSLITNDVRAPMHPVDRFEAFADLVTDGQSEADIAATYALTERQVHQVLALGRLSTVVLQAWREEKIDAATAQAFTLQPDQAEQSKLFAKLKKGGQLTAWSVRQAIGADDRQSAMLVNFVGEKAYVAAGGSIVRDLFGDRHVVSDPALARKLADEKIQAKIDALLAEGWAFAERGEDVPDRWSYGRIDKGKKKFTADDRKASGCFVGLSYQGALEIEYGRIRPAAVRKQKSVEAKQQREANGLPAEALPKALAHRLSIALTLAARTAAAEDNPSIALAAFIARFGDGVTDYDAPVKLRNEARLPQGSSAGGDPSEDHDPEDQDDSADVHGRLSAPFVRLFEAALKLTLREQLARVAEIIGRAFDFQELDGGSALHRRPGAAAIVNAFDPAIMGRHLQRLFDPADYFGAANGALRIKAVAEAINADEAAKVAKMKKAEAVAYCIANVAPTGWLPPELRTAHYRLGSAA